MSDDVGELKLRLEEAFRVATKFYQKRGFERRIGFGRKPALVNVDLANAWTRPGNPFTCDDIDNYPSASAGIYLEAGYTLQFSVFIVPKRAQSIWSSYPYSQKVSKRFPNHQSALRRFDNGPAQRLLVL